MTFPRLVLLMLLAPALALAQPPPNPRPPPPTDAACVTPPPRQPLAFSPGEVLDFDLDALGAEAGKMQMRILPVRAGLMPIEVKVQTNTFFSKVRKVSGGATSYLNPRTLRPSRYVEDVKENDVPRLVTAQFLAAERKVQLDWKIGDQPPGKAQLPYANDALDAAGVIAAIRQLPFKEGLELCFDVYAIRRIWRVSGKVMALEQHTTPLGVFKVWHLAGEAVRLDNHNARREVHVWVTDDARRLPLAAVGVIDLGAVRATLVRHQRPGEKTAKAEGAETLKW